MPKWASDWGGEAQGLKEGGWNQCFRLLFSIVSAESTNFYSHSLIPLQYVCMYIYTYIHTLLLNKLINNTFEKLHLYKHVTDKNCAILISGQS